MKRFLKRNPHIGLSELYGKLKKNYAYTRHPASLFRFLRKQGIYVTPESHKSKYKPSRISLLLFPVKNYNWMLNMFLNPVIWEMMEPNFTIYDY